MLFKKAPILNEKDLPVHIAFIMDGNGRWAKKRGMPRLFGHNAGTETLKRIVMASKRLNIQYITFYAFSTENWKRPSEEVEGLMKILVKFIRSEINEIHRNNIKINILGDYKTIPTYAKEEVERALDITQNNDGMYFNIALNYGGRDEIIHAVKNILIQNDVKKIDLDHVNESFFSDYLYTKGMPDPDLLIRTSGEQRLSNFMLWQMAYTEFVFESGFWPDFNEKSLQNAITSFQERNRRYGAVKE